MSIVCVSGGRDFADWPKLRRVLDDYHARNPITLLVQGYAPGADSLAVCWAGQRGVSCAGLFAEWARYGNAAGPQRNAELLAKFAPDVLLAFPTGGPGTAGMIELARRARITTHIYE